MSIFSKFKFKKAKTSDELPEPEVSQPLPTENPEVSELHREEPVYSESHFLRNLYKMKDVNPDIIQAVMPNITEIQATIEANLETIEAYREWENTDFEVKQEEVSATQDDSEYLDNSSQLKDPETVDGSSPQEMHLPPFPAADASVKVFSSSDNLYGFLYCIAPIGDGKDISLELLESAVTDFGIQYGIIDQTLAEIAKKQDYYTVYLIAQGKFPVKGKDGQVTEHFLRTQEIRLEENEKGMVDYKNLHLFHNIAKGDIICDIVAPAPGTDGCDIMGNVIPAPTGSMPVIPQGKNTVVNEEHTALIAAVDGDLSFNKNVFRVEPQLTIPGNVDGSTGNIDFTGDVLVNGDVLRGFKINASGNITILGLAEGAILTSGEDIDLRKGMNGSGSGVLIAEGDIHSRFLEQTKVTAGGDVITETIINCKIVSGGSISATSGKGIIIGGSLTAQFSVEAKRIGSLSNAKTVIRIGNSIENENNVVYLTTELQQSKEALIKIEKNINFLKGLPSIPSSKAELYRTLTEQRQLYENQIRELQFKIDVAQSKEFNASQCHVRGDTVYGITEIYMKHSKLCVQETTTKCNVYFSNDELVLGTF